MQKITDRSFSHIKEYFLAKDTPSLIMARISIGLVFSILLCLA